MKPLQDLGPSAMTRADIPDLCTAKQGASYLQIALSTWYAWEQTGALPTHRLPSLGRRVHYCGVRLRAYGTADDIKKRTAKAVRTAVATEMRAS